MASYWQQVLQNQAAKDELDDRRRQRGLLDAAPYRARLLLGDRAMQDQPTPNFMDVRGAMSERGMNPGATGGMPQQAPQLGLGQMGQARQMMGMGADPMAVAQSFAPTFQKFSPGEKGGMVGPDGQFTETVSPSLAPQKPNEFKPTNMQRPETNDVRLARTQDEYDALAGKGFVESDTSVPGMKAPVTTPTPNDFEVDPTDPTRRRMVRGGSAAVAQAERLATPLIAERKLYNEAATQYATLTDLSQDDTGASDIGLIYGFFKAADPVSSVRESEFDTVGAKMGLSNAVIGAMKSVAAGKGFLTPKVRQALVDTAGRSIKQRKAALKRSYTDTTKAMDPLGVDRKAFIPFSVTDVNISDVRKQFPDAKQDTAGRAYIEGNGKRSYIEVDD